MYEGRRVVAVTPAGRRRYMSVLLPYVLRDRHVIDEWHLWQNTTDHEDLAWMRRLADRHPFVTLVPPSRQVDHQTPAHSISQYFKTCVDPGTVYVRLDDDVVYVHPGAVAELCRVRMASPEPFLVYANVVNNAVCTHIHQRLGIVGLRPRVSYSCLDPVGWGDPHFALAVHETFLGRVVEGAPGAYLFGRWEMWEADRFSINCFAFLGSDFAGFGGEVGGDEEEWLTVTKPRESGRGTVVAGGALVSHFAFFTQREFLDKTNLLERYAGLI